MHRFLATILIAVVAGCDEEVQATERPDSRPDGPIATRVDLAAYRDMLVDIRGKVAAGIAAGQTLAQIQATKPAGRYGMADGFIKADRFVETVYESLRNPPASRPHSH